MSPRSCFLFLAVFAVACGGGGGGGGGGGAPINAVVPDACSTVEQNRFVNDAMLDIYYWVDEMPSADPADFATPQALLDFLVFPDLDRFSAIVDAAAEDAFFSASQFIGIGMGILLLGEDELRVTQTFSDGPARAAGIRRGFTILEINGQTIAEAVAGNGVSAAFGADEIDVPVELRYTDLAGTEMQVTLFKALVTIDTVSASAVFDVAGATTGYLKFRNFVEPSFDALATTFADLVQQGVTQLVLDLRYNGGGLISVAEFLSGLLGGQTTAGEVFAKRVHNTENEFRNLTTNFVDETNALDLSRVVIITTGATASASEMIINGLDPFLDVWLVGDDTFGKPVGSYGFTFCDKVLRPTSFANENAVGNTDYFAGFAADCAAEDELDRALGDPQEASLAEAL
ncbi:MAG: S41 family peptidase, partial [Gammaproteobacteria bacterium]|nr:S41 family peptidase [Gammaproteobacteria bacterium]